MTKTLIITILTSVAFTMAHAQTTSSPAPAPTNNTIANPGGANTNFGTVNSNGVANPAPGVTSPSSTTTNNTSTTSSPVTNTNTANPNAPAMGTVGTSNTTAFGVPAANTNSMNMTQIRAAQTALSNNGYAIGVDGVLGNKTADAIRTYQRDNGLNQTGVFDAATLKSLQLPANDMRAPASINDNQ